MITYELVSARIVYLDGKSVEVPEIVEFRSVDKDDNIHRGTFLASETDREITVTQDGRRMTARQIKDGGPLPAKVGVAK